MPDTLAQLVRAKYPGAYDDISDADLESSIKAKHPGAYDDIPTTSAKPVGVVAQGSTFGEKIGNAASMLGSVMPAAGGILGGLYGGPAGAAAGGGAGEGFRQLLQHGAEIPGAMLDVAGNLIHQPMATIKGAVQGTTTGGLNTGGEAIGQAIGQKAGDVLAAGATGMSKWLMNRATSRVSAKLAQEFPDLSNTLIDNALTVSKGGYGQALGLLRVAKAKANTAVQLADSAGAKIPVEMTQDLAESFKTALLNKAIKSGKVPAVPNEPLAVASKRLDQTTKDLFSQIDDAANPNTPGSTFDLSPSHADLLKTQLQKESRALYANRTAPNGPKAIGMDAAEKADYATQLNSKIDQVATGYKAANTEAQPLIGAMRGIQQSIRPSGNLLQAMVRPAVGAMAGGNIGGAEGYREGGGLGAAMGASAGAIAGGALMSPAGMSREAIILAHPAIQGALQALPKPLADWLVQAIATHSGQQP
jgi:hypothetical protein